MEFEIEGLGYRVSPVVEGQTGLALQLEWDTEKRETLGGILIQKPSQETTNAHHHTKGNSSPCSQLDTWPYAKNAAKTLEENKGLNSQVSHPESSSSSPTLPEDTGQCLEAFEVDITK